MALTKSFFLKVRSFGLTNLWSTVICYISDQVICIYNVSCQATWHSICIQRSSNDLCIYIDIIGNVTDTYLHARTMHFQENCMTKYVVSNKDISCFNVCSEIYCFMVIYVHIQWYLEICLSVWISQTIPKSLYKLARHVHTLE